MSKPAIILDPHWRGMSELFSSADLHVLGDMADVVWGQDTPMPQDKYANALGRATVLVTATPDVTQATLDVAPHLSMVIEVSGAFPDTIDYAACVDRGVEVLSCAPGFRAAVAEMGLAMTLGAGRGLVAEHEAFRTGQEAWLEDQAGRDFTLFGADVGFVGFGQIAQELTRLLAPFQVTIRAYDPWLPQAVANGYGVALMGLDDVLSASRVTYVAAVPTAENLHLMNAARLAKMPDGALLVLLSRAHLVDFSALVAEVGAGRLRAAADVFPTEPVAPDDLIRTLPGIILSPHRAAAVPGGRQLIGRMITADIAAMITGDPARQLQKADLSKMGVLAGVGDAAKVADMAGARKS